jgi:hypothetical protein
MSKTFYLAGKVAGNNAIGELKDFSEELEQHGHVNTYPWWKMKGMAKEYLDHIDVNARFALDMVQAVINAEIFVLFAQPDILGAATELGVALASAEYDSDKRIYIIGAYAIRQSVFYTHPRVENVNNHIDLRNADWY